MKIRDVICCIGFVAIVSVVTFVLICVLYSFLEWMIRFIFGT